MKYTTLSTIIVCIAIATAVAIYYRWRALMDERQELANQLDHWTTSGMTYYKLYPRFEWPAKFKGHAEMLTEHSLAKLQFDYDDNGELDYSQPEGRCPSCHTEDVGRYANTADPMCIDCQDQMSDTALIVDDIYQHRFADGGTVPPMPDYMARNEYCAHCLDQLRLTEYGGSLCSSCSAMASRWYTKALDTGLNRGRPDETLRNPHSVIIGQAIYDNRDAIVGATFNAVEINSDDHLNCPDEFDLWVEYVPPVQGPREGSRSPTFRSDFVPTPIAAIDMSDDIPF